MDGSAVEDPGLVRPGEEEVAGLLDPLDDLPVGAAADPLRREQPDPLRAALGDHRPRLLVPVGHEVGLLGNPAVVDLEQGVDVLVAKVRPQQLAAEEGRVPDDELSVRPGGLLRLRRIAEVEEGVLDRDLLEWL